MSSTLSPALSKLDAALEEFSKAKWAVEPGAEEPTDDVVATRALVLRKRLPHFLAAFCSGVAATLVWQSHGDTIKRMIARHSAGLHWSSSSPAPPATPATGALASGPSRTITPAPATGAVEAGGTTFVVQLSAARSEPEAQAAAHTMQAKYSVLSGRRMLIRRKDQGERGIFYAAQVGPFGVKSDADQLCETLKSAGTTCFVQKN